MKTGFFLIFSILIARLKVCTLVFYYLMDRHFKFPGIVVSDKAGFSYLATIVNEVLNIPEDNIFFDFSECSMFECNLCGILGSAFQEELEKGRNIFLRNVDKDMKRALVNLGFLTRTPDEQQESDTNQVTYARFKIDDEMAIMAYVETGLLDTPGLPRLTEDLKKEILRNILEMYINAVVHGDCQYVYSSGHIHKRSSSAEMHFTLVDLGRTIKENVNKFIGGGMTGSEAIEWATSGYNTTKTHTSGGLGLKLMKQFIANNNGKLQIVSADGFWEFSKDYTKSELLTSPFPGTIVNIIFNLNDAKLHYLDGEAMPTVSDIF